MDEHFTVLMKKLSFSPSRSPGYSRLQFGAVSQRSRSSSGRKPPEPLRRAVADCLSSSLHHSNPSTVSSEAARTLRDYLASPSTVDVAYTVLLEHALAEKDRSPAVVARCVALLKRYLLRYVPKEETLLQIDLFCVNSVAECDSAVTRKICPWSKPSNQTSGSGPPGNAAPSSLPTSTFASNALIKSLKYVRSLVAHYVPRLSFQPAAFAGASTASKQALPSLSSILSRSFNSQLKPGAVNSKESPESKEISNSSAVMSSISERNELEDIKYMSSDVLQWRWCGETAQQSLPVMPESDGVSQSQNLRPHNFLEVGAAALLVGDMEAKMKGQPLKLCDTKDVSDFDQLLQPSAVTTATNFALAPSHLRAITSSKRMKPSPDQIWQDVTVSTFRPRARPLFQYRCYSEQQPLRLNPAEVSEVIAAVCLEASPPHSNIMTVSSKLTNYSGKPSLDVAVSVLIKLVIDMYVLDSMTAAPLTLSMLEEMLRSQKLMSRVRAFDLILNLGVHAQLLEPMFPEISPTIEEESSLEPEFNNEEQCAAQEMRTGDYFKKAPSISAIEQFESWILSILYEILLLLVQIEERNETVWASALSCLLFFVCDRGKICRSRLEGLDIRVIKVLLEISREHSWAELVHSKLICMLTNMLYHVPIEEDAVPSIPVFLPELIDLLGGIEFICIEYSQANSREEKRNLFSVLFDYVLHLINETSSSAGESLCNIEEIQPLARMLILADAPEAFYIAVKHGVDGIGEILRKSVSEALSRYPNVDHQNMLLEKISRKFDATIGSFTRLDDEFMSMIQLTKSCKLLQSIDDGFLDIDTATRVKLSWATLHSLLHSERMAYRQNGYIWLVELLVSEISEGGGTNIWSNINNLQKQIEIAGSHDSFADLSVSLPIWIFCGLLKSKHNFIRWGFLFVLEKLLMRCKLLLDENKVEHIRRGEVVTYGSGGNRLEEANAVIDIMSSALTLVAQKPERDRINILKMCDILFSQLCLRLPSAVGLPLGGCAHLDDPVAETTESSKSETNTHAPQLEKTQSRAKILEEISDLMDPTHPPSVCETASLAALVLRGHAVVPMKLVAQVRPILFYWPLIQLAGAATDDIALGVAVGSKGRANLPGATSDIRAALLLLLIGKCTEDSSAFQDVEGEGFFRGLLEDTDSRVAYYSSAFLLKRMMTEEPERYQWMLHRLLVKAQQSNNEKLLENPYLQMRGIIQLSNRRCCCILPGPGPNRNRKVLKQSLKMGALLAGRKNCSARVVSPYSAKQGWVSVSIYAQLQQMTCDCSVEGLHFPLSH
ncbi:hypothetical protein H6P81_016483 [Aristolochia fimbriata]|uniref:Uncharacterized protein n=1 Tax=Aristolochia fimbriata TaxID=158543 RepID=A0AAV7ED13_ARIFI|nr:hypothetical protein H6P81_016483 [Aristolochia fimbriata]